MTIKSSSSIITLVQTDKKLIVNDKPTPVIPNSFHRPSRVLPTLTQSFSSSSNNLGINVDFGSKLKYFSSFKNLKKITEMRNHHKQPQTPISSYLCKLEEKKLAPVPMGLIKKNGVCEKLDTSNLSMGDNYAEAMSEGLKILKVRKIILKNNGLSDTGACKLITSLDPRYSTEISLSENHIGKNSISAIIKLNSSAYTKLDTINLESNNLSDKNISLLCNSLARSGRVKELILSNNKISDEGAVSISGYIKDSSCLEKLDLSWNNIRAIGANSIFKAMIENESIRVLDLSWNSISSPSEQKSAKTLAELFEVNKTLIHLDISNNMLGPNDCDILSEGLKKNKSLLGLHIEGNHGEIDTRGYLYKIDTVNNSNSLNYSRISQKSKSLKLKNKNCWICQKWNEVEFKWRNGKSGPYGEEPIMVHLSFENYVGFELQEQSDSYYRTIRMCPPRNIFFYFTLKGKFYLSSEYEIIDKTIETDYGLINSLNTLDNPPSPSQLWFELKPRAKPRDNMFKKEEELPWDFGKSVFREYIADTPELLKECFNEDIEKSKIKELVGKEYSYLYNYLKQHYAYIKDSYKHFASVAWFDWDVWLEILTEFCIKTGIIDNEDMRESDIESIIKTFRYWNSTTEIYFCRYQYMELLVRISIIKYYRNRKTNKIASAVKLFFKTYMADLDNHSSQDFRTKKLYTQTIDKILYRHLSVLIKLYYNFASENRLNLAGFYKIMTEITKDYAIIQSSFILSKETSVTYSYYDDYLKFVEFLEAFVRVVDASKRVLNAKARLELVIDEIIEVKLEGLLQSYKSL